MGRRNGNAQVFHSTLHDTFARSIRRVGLILNGKFALALAATELRAYEENAQKCYSSTDEIGKPKTRREGAPGTVSRRGGDGREQG